MKMIAIALGLASGMAANLFAGETLRLKLEPDRDYVLSGSPREVVVKIDLSAIGHKPKARRTPLNLAVVLDRSGSMTGAKIEKARQAARAAFARIAELDAIMSDYRPASELMQLCRKAGGEPVHVSKELFFVLSRAQEVSRLSDGAFDVTVGPIVRLWRLARRSQQLPDAKELAATAARTRSSAPEASVASRAKSLARTGGLRSS